MDTEIRREVALQINYLGDSEYALAFSCSETKDVASIVEEINKHRATFTSGKTCNIGSAEFASSSQWQAMAAESEKAARNILMQSSSELAELDRLEKAALEAKRLADAKNRELDDAWSDFQSIREKANRINSRLANLKSERESLDAEKLNGEFREFYSKMLQGAIVDHMALVFQAGVIATRDLRLEVIERLETESQKELAELKAKSKALARKLGQKANI